MFKYLLYLMTEFSPLLWLALAIGLAVFEAITVDLVAIWFGLGAVVTILPAWLGLPFWVQAVTFITVSGLSMFFTRPIVKQKLMVKNVPTNADRSIGRIAKVTMTIDNVNETGRVHLDGLDWTARSEDGDVILEGEQVLVKSISGVKLIVERLM